MKIDIFKLAQYIISLICLIILIAVPLTCAGQDYKRNGNIFESTKVIRSKSEPIKTEFTYKDSDNITYPIYISSTGSCFINKISKKSGKEYRKYLGAEISEEICKELKITYKGKTTKVKNS